MTLALAVGLPFLAALGLFALPNVARNAAAGLAGGVTLLVLALLGAQLPAVLGGDVVEIGWRWLPLAGADFGFRADGLALVFALLVLAIGALVILYARYYLAADDPMARFYAFLHAVHGRHARRRAGRQPAVAGGVLGADQPRLVPADRLLAAAQPMRARVRGWR